MQLTHWGASSLKLFGNNLNFGFLTKYLVPLLLHILPRNIVHFKWGETGDVFYWFFRFYQNIWNNCNNVHIFIGRKKTSIDFVKCTLFFNPKSMWSILQMLALKNFTMELPKSVFGADYYFKPFSKRKISKVYYVRRRHSCDKDSAPYQRIEVWQQLCLHLW